jgi:hypothetical protein
MEEVLQNGILKKQGDVNWILLARDKMQWVSLMLVVFIVWGLF